MQEKQRLSRRVFLARTAGLTLTLGTASFWRPERAWAARNPYTSGVWLAGDHHIHTQYSSDGEYRIIEQVANAARYGLGWCVITDHGGPHHDKVALAQAYPDLVEARTKHPEILVFQGLEWNIPSAEHGSVILPPTPDEARRISDFEAQFDGENVSRHTAPPKTEADAIAGVKYLESLTPKPLFIANHPARNGLDSPHEMRAWSDAGPHVTRGFEGAPGHQAGTLNHGPRGAYGNSPHPDSFSGYPTDSYRTFGGYDWYVATVGGLWDSLLSEGRPWYITADSDSHRHWDDRSVVDETSFDAKGYVTRLDKKVDTNANLDFYPGEYSKTWVHAAHRTHMAVLDALRGGHMFTVLGGLIDRLELFAQGEDRSAPMGSTLLLERAGADVTVTIRIRVPRSPNFGGKTPQLHHVDLIAGDILRPASDRDAMTNPTARVVKQFHAAEAAREGDWLRYSYRFPAIKQSFYIRVRGTSTEVETPQMDSATVNPWDDLWFYSNPVMIRVP